MTVHTCILLALFVLLAHCRRTLLCSELFAYLGPIAVGYVMLARLLSQYCQEAFHFCLAFDLLWFGPGKI